MFSGKFNQCTISVGSKKILKIESLEYVGKGFTFLKGNNGSGKTVFMTSLLGMNSRGIDGYCDIAFAKEEVGYISDIPFFFDDEKVSNILRFLCYLYGETFETTKAIAEYLFNDEGFMDKKAVDLSSGMKKKLQLIPLYFNKVEHYFLDEVFKGVDDETVERVVEHITTKILQGCSFLVIEHDTHIQEQIEKKCGKVGEIRCENGSITAYPSV